MRAVAGTTIGKRGNETDLYGAGIGRGLEARERRGGNWSDLFVGVVFGDETDLFGGVGIGEVVPGWTHKGGAAWGAGAVR